MDVPIGGQPESIRIMNDADVGSSYPLDGVTEQDAIRFHNEYELPIEQDQFVRGVLALRHQASIEPRLRKIVRSSPEARVGTKLRIGKHRYTRLEIDVLYNAWTRSKTETLRNLSRLHRLLVVACIYAAMTQGWDQAAMAGAAINVMDDLGKHLDVSKDGSTIPLTTNTWLLGVTVGVPFFGGAILGLIITDSVARITRFGRRGAICLAGIFSLISVVGSASVHKWEHLLGFRILLGAGMAGKASIVPILLSETSPKNIRGVLLVFWQLFVAFGLCAGSIANLSVYKLSPQLDHHASWRYMFIAAFIPALLLLSLILFSPESPRWLLKESGAINGHDDPALHRRSLVRKAYLALFDLRGEPVPILVAGELYLLYTRLIEEQRRLRKDLPRIPPPKSLPNGADQPHIDLIEHIDWWPRVQLMFFKRGSTRRAHLAAAAVMISQQLCGINLLAFMADTFFRYSIFHQREEAQTDDNRRLLVEQNLKLLGSSVALMGVNFFATFGALFFIDRGSGRRTLLNWSFPCMAISLLGSALVLLGSDKEPSTGAIAGHYTFLILFIVAYSIGEGPAAFVVSAEVFPLVNRELGMSLAVFWNFLGAGLLALVSPVLWNELGQIWVLISDRNGLVWSGLRVQTRPDQVLT
ncbi:MFS sugar transporter like protein [Pyrenophora tritici-repentis]|nr:MFS sugar transporter like protein [Pyrenophora tritici-repentis]